MTVCTAQCAQHTVCTLYTAHSVHDALHSPFNTVWLLSTCSLCPQSLCPIIFHQHKYFIWNDWNISPNVSAIIFDQPRYFIKIIEWFHQIWRESLCAIIVYKQRQRWANLVNSDNLQILIAVTFPCLDTLPFHNWYNFLFWNMWKQSVWRLKYVRSSCAHFASSPLISPHEFEKFSGTNKFTV